MCADNKLRLVIVSGLSGSGKSVALHTLEDIGYYCIDNLPMYLLRAMAKELKEQSEFTYNKMAVSIDARNQTNELHQLPQLVKDMRKHGVHSQMLFLEANDHVLLRRFSETRRRHPLTTGDRSLLDAIQLEREILEPYLSEADLRIDTSETNQHELRDLIRSHMDERKPRKISIQFQSFGYKHGVPRDVDFVYDVRCLPNPHWEKELRSLTGLDPEVAKFLEGNNLVEQLKSDIISFLERWVPIFEADGRNYLTVAIGCTGGQHRSVYLVEQISSHFQQSGRDTITRHRELS
ncbi:MAG: RNase adapter RapZ [Gammaproteobacteria bacterium]